MAEWNPSWLAAMSASGPMNDETDMIECPKCGAEQEDFDGFGVLYCEKCGYCTHASVDGNVCGLCKKTMPEVSNARRLDRDEETAALEGFRPMEGE